MKMRLLISLSGIWLLAGITSDGFAESRLPPVDSALCRIETELGHIARGILYGESDSARLAANIEFTPLLVKALERPDAFRYPFDSLVTIARLYAPDSCFRLFNWNLPKDDGTFIYFGLILMNEHPDNPTVFLLTDRSEGMKDMEHQTTDHTGWPGAHYYQIIRKESPARCYYTLLGWDGNTRFTTRKIIDVLVFDKDKIPVFGAPIFPDYQKGDQTRIIFEYSSNATMSLKYDTQTYTAIKNINASRPRYKTITTQMIVFDHLEPMDPSLSGQYSFYVPVGNIFDAFVFKDGYWRFHPDIDAKNPELPEDSDSKRPSEFDLFPPADKK